MAGSTLFLVFPFLFVSLGGCCRLLLYIVQQEFYDAAGGHSWNRCSGSRQDPCACVEEGGVGDDSQTEEHIPKSSVECIEIVRGKQIELNIDKIRLYSNNLAGSLPKHVFSKIKHLSSVVVFGNNITGRPLLFFCCFLLWSLTLVACLLCLNYFLFS